MPRLMLILLVIALTVFAVADWFSRSRGKTPGRINRWAWLAVIVLLPVVGPLAWIISGAVTRAEARQAGEDQETEELQVPPDYDPEAISSVADRLARRQKRTRPASGAHQTSQTDTESTETSPMPGEANEDEDPSPQANA